MTLECAVRSSVNQEALVDIVKSLAEASARTGNAPAASTR
jgi:hypothetical protein